MFETNFQLAELSLAGLSSFAHPSGVVQPASPVVLPDDGRPLLLFLHGWQDNAASFDALFSRLAPACHWVAVDWPGHGWSPSRSADNYYHFFDYLDDLHQLMALLPSREIVLVGHSLGALVSGCYAAAYPAQITGLVLIEGLAPLYEAPELVVERLRQGLKGRQRYREFAERFASRRMGSFDEALALRCAVNSLSASQLTPLVKRALCRDEHGWYWRHDNRLRCDSLYRICEDQAKALMSAVGCPVLSIIGAQGFTRLKQPAGGFDWLPQAEQVEVAGGHHCHLESPQAVCDQIIKFLSQFK
ncbi:alpha/beta fold hydrolase [Photobacterium sp. TY1-4]|uniref:alpha/beta fold hydrolase n=1 Tax=Photobacterium sp. TY1-4 TaxID=2899122 RepID=UPI0021BF3897|nr:alpha/beta hydrolase [Photobacterium sp. TY1-4]UXI02106.1 alpha/beta hydrolase [Photobacterium sp. TY1-4]